MEGTMNKIKAILAAASVACLALLGLSGTAMASDNGNGATLYANNFQCGGATNLATPAGFVNFHETGDQLTLIVHVQKAEPNDTYSFFLYDEFCTPDTGATILTVTTNSNGVGNGTVTVTATPGATYFLSGFDPTFASTMQTQGITP
jgi:hypothetical protein